MAAFKVRPLTQMKTKQKLFDLGHINNNPAYLNDVKESDLPKLRLTDPAIVNAAKSFTAAMPLEYDEIALQLYGERGHNSGVIGKATKQLLLVDRCGYPDYETAAAVRKAGSGSWPSGCDPLYPGIHVFKVHFDFSGMPSWWGKASDPTSVFSRAWAKCQAAWANVGVLMIQVSSKSKANSVVTWVKGNGWIGLAQLPNNPHCKTVVFARFDNRYRPSDMVNMLARLLAHEFGHNFKLRHTSGGFMNSSIVRGTFLVTALRESPSFNIIKRYTGGKPIGINDPPLPPDEDDDTIEKPGPDWEPFAGSWAKGDKLEQFVGFAVET